MQTRGPVHEAYAQPIEANPQPGAVIPKEPPAPIPEEQPEPKPEGDNAQWIPGYWSWDPVRQDFVWVSGVYRVAPQSRRYVPGSWTHTDDGWRWVPGFWAPDQQAAIPMTPAPPASLDSGPSSPAPDSNSLYIPGNWVYRDDHFVWRPGYYAAEQAGRVWVPAHYVWTPNGYLFVAGYWDYPMESRGVLYAPVYVQTPLAANAGWSYQPNYVVNVPAFFDSGFVLGNSFYFGNYYNPAYASLGFRPWYSGAGRYDPLFSYYGWQNYRNNPNWIAGAQQTFANRASGRVAGPPTTLAQQTALLNTRGSTITPVVSPVVRTANQVRSVKTAPAQLNTQRAIVQQTNAGAIRVSPAISQTQRVTPHVVAAPRAVASTPIAAPHGISANYKKAPVSAAPSNAHVVHTVHAHAQAPVHHQAPVRAAPVHVVHHPSAPAAHGHASGGKRK